MRMTASVPVNVLQENGIDRRDVEQALMDSKRRGDIAGWEIDHNIYNNRVEITVEAVVFRADTLRTLAVYGKNGGYTLAFRPDPYEIGRAISEVPMFRPAPAPKQETTNPQRKLLLL